MAQYEVMCVTALVQARNCYPFPSHAEAVVFIFYYFHISN